MDYVDDYLFDGIRVLLGEDGTVIREDGRPVLQYVWGKYWVNNHAHILKAKADYSLEAIYIALARTTINHIVTGAVQMKISQKNLSNLELELPSQKSLDYLKDVFSLYRNNAEESKRLECLRDTLLPKLMSGEIDASKVDLTQLNSHLIVPSRRLIGHLTGPRYEWQGGNQVARMEDLIYRFFDFFPRLGDNRARSSIKTFSPAEKSVGKDGETMAGSRRPAVLLAV